MDAAALQAADPESTGQVPRATFLEILQEHHVPLPGDDDPKALKTFLDNHSVGKNIDYYLFLSSKKYLSPKKFMQTKFEPKVPKVKIKVGKAIAKPKTLAEIKARAAFAESPLVRQGRLSVVPLTGAQFGWLVGE